MAGVQFDPDGKTLLYILYVDKLQLDDSAADLIGSEVAIFWYVGEQCHCSQNFTLTKEPVRCSYCCFFSITMPELPKRSQDVTMTLCVDDNHIGVAFLNFDAFGEDENFKDQRVELLTESGVVAVAHLHTASQPRWSYSPIEPSTGYFVDHAGDDQAKQLHDFIYQQEAAAGGHDKAKEDAKKEEEARKEEARKVEEKREEARREAEAAAERQRQEQRDKDRREEEKRKQEEEERDLARRREEDRNREREQEESRRREEDRREQQRKADEEERRLRERVSERERADQRPGERHERLRRWEEEEEAERRRREEFERRKKEFMEKEAPHAEDSGRRKERQQWEEDRERLKRDARRLRERELADIERRAEERRRQIEALTNSRLAAVSSTAADAGPASRLAAQPVMSKEQPRGTRESRNGRAKTARQGTQRRVEPREESEASEPCDFEGERDLEEDEEPARAAPGGFGGNFRWPRTSQTKSARGGNVAKRPGAAGQLVMRGGMQTMISSPAHELSLAERLEHFRSHAHINRLGAAQRDVVVDSSSGPVPMLESMEMSTSKEAHSRSVNNTPRKKSGMRKADEGKKVCNNAVLAAVLQDAAGAGFGLSAQPVAAMEEALLRLLVLHKELGKDQPQAALADATKGLAPRMLQVLEAAKAVCEANRTKLLAYTEEKQLGIDRSDYLVPQMKALDKLHGQFSSLVPGQSEVLQERCECGADFSADAKFCRLCGRRRDVRVEATAARLSPRREYAQPLFAHGYAPSLTSSPPATARNLGFAHSAREGRPDRPVDPGLPDSQLPALRGGSPQRAKFREESFQAHSYSAAPGLVQSTPRSEVSSAQPFSSREAHRGARLTGRTPVPAIPHWERQHLARAEAEASSVMWDSVAAAVVEKSPRPAVRTAARDNRPTSPLWDAVASSVAPMASMPGASARRNSRERRSPRAISGEPLRSAMQQVRGVADELRHGRGGGGGAHAGAGSPSPETRQEPVERPAPEDKYLKILQSLQAKGAMNGGLAAQLLEKQGVRIGRRSLQARAQALSSDSDSSEYLRR